MVVFSICNNLWIGVDCPLKTSPLVPSRPLLIDFFKKYVEQKRIDLRCLKPSKDILVLH